MLNDGETYDFEERTYVTPTLSRDEQLQFIENLRATQEQGNQDIRTQTRNLGTDIPLNQGGLTGADSYFTQRYQTPQTNAIVSQLQTAAQASALNNVLNNLQSQIQNQYNQSYRNYQRRAYDASRAGSGNAASAATTASGNVNETSNDGAITVSDQDVAITTAPAREGLSSTSYTRNGDYITEYSDGSVYVNGVYAPNGYQGHTVSEKDYGTTSNAGSAANDFVLGSVFSTMPILGPAAAAALAIRGLTAGSGGK